MTLSMPPIRPLLRRVRQYLGLAPKSAALYPADFTDTEIALCERMRRATLTSPERMISLYYAVRYVLDNAIPGAFVECGVYKGGSVMMMIEALKERGAERPLYLYDTYEGMPAPGEHDVKFDGRSVAEKFNALKISETSSHWINAGLEEVRGNVLGTGYPEHLCHFIKGMVEETIPATIPEQIALLRLDTDFYESTRHELTHLYPRLSPGGILIIDDYGNFLGARKAVDEYFAAQPHKPLLQRIDTTGRLVIKTAAI
jgi:O-methyltransferase